MKLFVGQGRAALRPSDTVTSIVSLENPEQLLRNWKPLWHKIMIHPRSPDELKLKNIVKDVCGSKNTKFRVKGYAHPSP